MRVAAERVRGKAILLATHLLEASPEDVGGATGASTSGVPDRRRELHELGRVPRTGRLPPGLDRGWRRAVFDPEHFTYPSGTHACVVEVDTDTGEVGILGHVAVDDCGRVIAGSDRRRAGARRRRAGHREALLEEAVYDQQGHLLTGSFRPMGSPRGGAPGR